MTADRTDEKTKPIEGAGTDGVDWPAFMGAIRRVKAASRARRLWAACQGCRTQAAEHGVSVTAAECRDCRRLVWPEEYQRRRLDGAQGDSSTAKDTRKWWNESALDEH